MAIHIFPRSSWTVEVDLARIRLDGTVHERLTRRDPYDVNPAWSLDGAQILWERCGVGSGLFTMNADGSGRIKVTSGFYGCTGGYPDWQPLP
jgi:Tol biopolymer transport system component